MFFKKAAAVVAALLTVAAMPCFAVFADEAQAPAASKDGFKSAAMDVIVYEDDKVQQIDCRFYDNMPNVAYVNIADYYKLWTDKALSVEKKADGTFEMTNPDGVKGVLNVEKDILSAEKAAFIYPPAEFTESGEEQKIFLDIISKEVSADRDGAIELNFGAYQIDIREDAETVWFPVTTLCDVFTNNLKTAFYLYDTLIFRPSYTAIQQTALTPQFADYYIEKYQNGRPQDLVDYNYNELCFNFDRVYGFPGRAPFTELIREKGFDGFLSEGNEMTKKVREWLHSTDIVEYTLGVNLLYYYLMDGGHTVFNATPVLNAEFAQKLQQFAASADIDPTGFGDQTDGYSKTKSVEAVTAARTALYESADHVEQLKKAVYCEKGDTAFFVFDTFETDMNAWIDYYNKNAEMPDDMLSEYVSCVQKADANPKIKNFVIDVATNGGGFLAIAEFMTAIASKQEEIVDCILYNQQTISEQTTYIFDKNLDKTIDEKDAKFVPDLRFALMASRYSFSSANLFPFLAHDNGLMVIGEHSGGGSCAVQHYLFADGLQYALSSGSCYADKNKVSVDAGLEPDYVLFTMNEEDFTKDFSAAYDIATLDKCFEEFYGKKEQETIGSSTTQESVTTTETTSVTTSESAQVTTSESAQVSTSATEQTVVSSEVSVSETSAAQTTATVASTTEEKVYTESEIAEMAKKDYETKKGTAPAGVTMKNNGDGTYSATLTDAQGKTLTVYTIDAKTGKGTDSNGTTVDLPQTGNNAFGTAAAAACAAAMILAGAALTAAAMRKKDENA